MKHAGVGPHDTVEHAVARKRSRERTERARAQHVFLLFSAPDVRLCSFSIFFLPKSCVLEKNKDSICSPHIKTSVYRHCSARNVSLAHEAAIHAFIIGFFF